MIKYEKRTKNKKYCMCWISWYGVDQSGNRKDSQFLWIFAYAVNYSLVYNCTASKVAVIK